MSALTQTEMIREIARRSGLSVSSVYKILHNPFDFSAETAGRVIKVASELGYGSDSLSIKKSLKFCVIIPSRPAYYWREAMAGMKAAERAIKKAKGEQIELQFIYIIFSQGEDAMRNAYQKGALSSVDGYIIYPVPFIECAHLIGEKSQTTPIILFNESRSDLFLEMLSAAKQLHQMNIASISSDAVSEGRSAFRIIENQLDKIQHTVIISTQGDSRGTSLTAVLRMENFRRELLSSKPESRLDYISMEIASKMTPSFLSVKLYDIQLRDPIDCIYITTGLTHVACAAVEKLKERLGDEMRAFCIGHECSPSDRKYIKRGIQMGYVKQDVYSQGYNAVMMLYQNLRESRPLKDRVYDSICSI